MNTIIKQVRRFCGDEAGAVAIEYVLIAAAMAVMLVAAMPLLAGSVNRLFPDIATAINSAFP